MDDYKAIESGKDYLAHHGVKGMKWGIRHDPERIGRAKKVVKDIGKKLVNGLKRKTKATYVSSKKLYYKRRNKKIEKAISSGNAAKINKVFSKMNDQQANRAINRMNQREWVLNTAINDIRRNPKDESLQRKINSINLQRQYNKAKHPILYKERDAALNGVNNAVGNITGKISNKEGEILSKEIGKALVKSLHSDWDNEKIEKYVGASVSSKKVKTKKLKHSDFMDLGEEYLSHHGVKGMKWGIRHDEDRISSLKLKKSKNQTRLDKAKGKKAKFNMKHRSLTARKAEIRMAKGKDPGLLGHLALAKSKKLDYKIAKLERKDAKLDKKITNAKADLDYSKAKDRFRQETARLGKEMAAFIKANNSLTKSPLDKLSNRETANRLRLIGQYKAARQLRDAKLNKIAIKKGKNSISYKLGQWDAKRNTEWYGNTKIHKNKDGHYEMTSYYMY